VFLIGERFDQDTRAIESEYGTARLGFTSKRQLLGALNRAWLGLDIERFTTEPTIEPNRNKAKGSSPERFNPARIEASREQDWSQVCRAGGVV
jgi:hypothetical protein